MTHPIKVDIKICQHSGQSFDHKEFQSSSDGEDKFKISYFVKLFFVLLPLILILAACGGNEKGSSNTPDFEVCKTDPNSAECEKLARDLCEKTIVNGCEALLSLSKCADFPTSDCYEDFQQECLKAQNSEACQIAQLAVQCSANPTAAGCDLTLQQLCVAAPSAAECDKLVLALKCLPSPRANGCQTILDKICNSSPNASICTLLNAVLGQAPDESTSIKNFITRVEADGSVKTGDGKDITTFKYGRLKMPSTGYFTEANFAESEFTEANTPELLADHKKISIIQITSAGDDEGVNISSSLNYYYSHIDGKQFTQILPALNTLELLILEDGGLNKIIPTPFTAKVFSQGNTYERFRNRLIEAKKFKYNYQGVTLARFSIEEGENNRQYGRRLYSGTFVLELKDIITDISAPSEADNHFSMLITFDKPVLKVATAPVDNPVNNTDPIKKPGMKFLEFKNFIMGLDFKTVKSYEEGRANEIFWTSKNDAWNQIYFSNDNKQIGGTLDISSQIDGSVYGIKLTYVSNEYCLTIATECPKVN